MKLRGAAGLLARWAPLAVIVAAAAGLGSGGPDAAAGAVTSCHDVVMFIRGSALVRLDDATGAYQAVAELPMLVNALAYAPDQQVFYGIAGSQIVTVAPDGTLTIRGPAPHGTSGAYAGAILGSRWYVRSGGPVSVLSIDVGAPDYLHVVRSVPVTVPGELGDFDVAADGRLYGIATGGSGPGRVVRIDTATGGVSVLFQPTALPGRGSYGAVAILGNTLIAELNATGTLYELALSQPDRVTTARPPGTAPGTVHADAAACPSTPPPPAPTPTPKPRPKPPPKRPSKPRPSQNPTPTPTQKPRPQPSHEPITPRPMPSTTGTLKPAAHRSAPWRPTGRLPLTWSVAALMVIPAAAATRVASKSLHRRR